MATKIEWCDLTLNPVVGCSKCSPGCENCYAEKWAYRLSKMPQTAMKYAGVVNKNGWTGKVNISLPTLEKIHGSGKLVFLCSMGDIFHENIPTYKEVPFDFHCELFCWMFAHPQHTFLLLTKRPERMRDVIKRLNQQKSLILGSASPFAINKRPMKRFPCYSIHQQQSDLSVLSRCWRR